MNKDLSLYEAVKILSENEDIINSDDILDDDEFEVDENEEFEKDIIDMFSSLIPDDFLGPIEEKFNDDSLLNYHFKRHCLAGSIKSSTPKNVYYDFNDRQDYVNRVSFIDNEKSGRVFSSVRTIKSIIDALDDLVNGRCNVYFKYSCGLTSKNGKRYSLKVHPFATNVTTNFGGITYDFSCYDRDMYNRTMFPVSEKELRKKIENIKNKYCREIILK